MYARILLFICVLNGVCVCLCGRDSTAVLQSIRRRRRLHGHERSDHKTIQVPYDNAVINIPDIVASPQRGAFFVRVLAVSVLALCEMRL